MPEAWKGPEGEPQGAPAGDGGAPGAWKAAVLADFARWLDALDGDEEDASAADGPAEGCDLHTLLEEMAALRQEVRLQSREQARALRHAEGEREALREAVGRLEGVCDELRQQREAAQARQAEAEAALEEAGCRARREGERACLVPLLEVRDALERGREAAVRVAGRRRWLRPRGAADVVAGYEMALSRFDRTLAALGVARVGGAGAPFDGRTMVAVGARREQDVPDEAVVEVLRPGFVREGDEVLRPAEVVVNRVVTEGERR